MMHRKRFLFLALVAFLPMFFASNKASAAIASNDIINQKAYYSGVITCFNTTGENGGLISRIALSDYDSANSLFDRQPLIVRTVGRSSSKISCKSLLTTVTEKKLSTTPTNDVSVKEQRLREANYSPDDSTEGGNDSGKKCYSFTYTKRTEKPNGEIVDKNYYTPNLCVSRDENGNFVTSTEDISGQYDYNHAGLAQIQKIKFQKLGTNTLRIYVDTDNTGFLGTTTYTYSDMDLSAYGNESQVLANAGQTIANIMGSTPSNSKVHSEDYVATGTMDHSGYQPSETWENTYFSTCQNYQWREDNTGVTCQTHPELSRDFENTANLDTEYVKFALRNTSNYDTVIKNFSNDKYDYDDLKFSDDEIYRLYQDYLHDIYGVSSITCSDNTLAGVGSYSARLWWASESKYSQNCYFNVDDDKKDIKVNGVFVDSKIFGDEIGLEEMLSRLNALNNTGAPEGSIVDQENSGGGITDDPSSGTGTTEGDPCYNAGVEGMSWILCPAINNMEYTASALDNTIQSWLSVEPELYNSDSSTYSVWEVMRNIANILMIIFLVVIIFSQLTGYGIDNYGVKRMLPRLIAMAILLNLSFIICQLAVDLSNILGVGLRNMFGSVGENLLAGSQFNMEEFIGNIITGIFAIVGVAGVAAPIGLSIVTAVSSGSAAMGVVIIVLALIMVIVAILLFFIMLGARMIMIIGCIAISPLAFACFILPNTQSLFKKWWDVFKAALIIFPICGALGGLSYLIKAIVVTTDGIHLWMMVVALIAPYLVFFLLPMLLKGALAAMGRIGGALTSMGNAFRGGLRSGSDVVRETNAYKNAQTEAARRRQERSAQATVDRLKARKRQRGSLSERETRLMARSQNTLDKLQSEDRAARTVLTESEFAQNTQPELEAAWEQAFDSGDTDRLDALTNVLTMRYGTNAAKFIGNTLARKQVVARDSAGNEVVNQNMAKSLRTLNENMTHNSTFAGHMKNKATDAYAMISGAGKVYDSSRQEKFRYENLQYFAQSGNNPASDLKDWSTQSSSTLQRAIDNGSLSTEMVRNLLESTDPSIQSGIQSDEGKRDVLQAHLHNMATNPSGMGPNLSTRDAAQAYRNAQASSARENEIYISHERDAERIGKVKIDIPAQGGAAAVSFEGYAAPADFNVGGASPVQDANGHYIYTDATTGRKWNATTGRYIRGNGGGSTT